MKSFVNTTFLIFICLSQYVSAHPGRTASDGCHYCRTNCGSWGVPWNERHCHGRVKDDPVENFIEASVTPEEALVSVDLNHSHERVILK